MPKGYKKTHGQALPIHESGHLMQARQTIVAMMLTCNANSADYSLTEHENITIAQVFCQGK